MPIAETAAGTFAWNFKRKDWEGYSDRHRHTFDTRDEAEAHELKTLMAYKLGKPYEPPTDTDSKAGRVYSISELVEHCNKLQWAVQRSAKYTHKKAHVHPQYRNALLFSKWAGPGMSAAEALKALRIDQYVLYRRELGNGGVTLKKHLSAVSTLLGRAVAMGLCPVAFRFGKVNTEDKGERRAFEDDEVTQILATAKELGRDDMHDLFVVLVETGIRPPHEIRRIPWRDINLTRITVDKSIAKNGKARKVPLSPMAHYAIKRMREEHGSQPGPFHWATFEEVNRFWKVLRRHLSWLDEKTTPYSFRHTRASTWANDRRINDRDACKWLGHSMAVHERYIHPIDQRDDFRELVAELYPEKGDDKAARIAALQAELAALQGAV